jgi:hypothetical protein
MSAGVGTLLFNKLHTISKGGELNKNGIRHRKNLQEPLLDQAVEENR